MLALGSSVAGMYVIVGPAVDPAAGVALNGAFKNTVVALRIAAANRISPPIATACPGVSPCAAWNDRRPPGVAPATAPPADDSGPPPSAAGNRGPYPGPPSCSHEVK